MTDDDRVLLTPKGVTTLALAYAREDVIAAVRHGDRPQQPLKISTAFAAYNRTVINEHRAGRL